MPTILDIGVFHAVLLLTMSMFALLAAYGVHQSVRHGRRVPAWIVLLAAGLPLVYATSWKVYTIDLRLESLLGALPAHKKQFVYAATLTHTANLQWLSALLVIILCLWVVNQLFMASTDGERPNHKLSIVAAILGGTLVLLSAWFAPKGFGPFVAWAPPSLYALLTLMLATVVRRSHLRGTGAEIAPLALLLTPLLVAAVDRVAGGWIASGTLSAVASTPPALKQEMMNGALNTIDGMQAIARAQWVLAIGLAALGPIALRKRSTPFQRNQLVAVFATSLVAPCDVADLHAFPRLFPSSCAVKTSTDTSLFADFLGTLSHPRSFGTPCHTRRRNFRCANVGQPRRPNSGKDFATFSLAARLWRRAGPTAGATQNLLSGTSRAATMVG